VIEVSAGKLACRAALCYNEDLIRFCRSVTLNNLRRDDRKANFYRMETIPQKQCSKCKNFFPATPEFFQRNHRKMKDGLVNQCKPCRNKKNREYHSRPDVRQRGLAQMKTYADEHKEEKRAYDQVYIQAHYEKKRLQGQLYYQTHKEQMRANQQVYSNTPTARLNAQVSHRNRRAREKDAQGRYTSEQIKDQYKRQKGKCYYCSHKVKLGEYHIEHIIPLARGGTNAIDNIVLACPRCNLSKGNKYPWEWSEGGKLL